MNKYSFLVFYAAYDEFLAALRQFGVVHIVQKTSEPTPEMQELFRKISEVKQSLKKLDWYKGTTPEVIPEISGESVFNKFKEVEKEVEHTQHQRARLEKESDQMEPWGNFDWDNIARLEAKGLHFRFFTCPAKKFQPQWLVDHYISLVHEEAGISYFVKIDREDDDISDFLDQHGIEQVVLPTSSLEQVKSELKILQEKNAMLHEELTQMAGYGKILLTKYINELQDEWQEFHVQQQTSQQVEGKVMLVEGFVPETRKVELDEYLEKKGILHIVSKPTHEEKVPVLLKNNRFSKLYEVIAKLYDLPNHTELDLVPFFAPFYMMFFGFCLGDAGYGLLIVLGCTIAKKKFPEMRDIFSLAQWLGLATIIFGMLTGTFFGINLITANIPFLEGVKKYMLDTDKLFNLAIILGAIQILFGMVVKVFNIRKSLGIRYAFSTIGWLVLLIGSGILFGMKKAQWVLPETASLVQNVIFGVSGLLIFVFNHPKRNVFINIGAGLWDAYGMASGLLGDLLSYIRLFALGVSSAILGFVFNELAMSLKPDNIILGPLVMIIILVIGHGITIFMASLGAFVHPMRLTFVEFYKNAGFAGGGKPYTPYKHHVS